MGQAYAGVLGPLAFLTVVGRGLLRGGGLESTLAAASLGLFAFAALGWLIGRAAEVIVDDAVRGRLEAERRSRQTGETDDAANAS